MPSSALPRRKYALSPGRGAPSPGLEAPFTPTEELFSWLPDEQCAACGAQVKASQLYCSDACKQKEGADHHRNRQQDAHAQGEHSLTPASAPPTAKLAPSTRHYFPNTTAADIDSLQRFRYPCPPSPTLVAQRKTTPSEKISPTTFFGVQANASYRRRDASRTSSRGESNGFRPRLGRRSSADSTDSSLASSSACLTDPSTPSPGTANRGCDSASSNRSNASIDDEDLNSSDFRLPPSVSPATAAMLTANHQSVYHHRSRSDRQVSPTQHQYPRRPRTSVGDVGETTSAAPGTTMSFARRPGSTNLPAPILYSPVLAAKNSTVNAEGTITRRSFKSRPDVRRSFDQIKAQDSGSLGGPSASADLVDASARSPLDTGLGMRVQRTRSDPSAMQLHPEGEASPEQHDSGASGSSSAARTMRAISPGSLTASNEVCGRPGCFGTSYFNASSFSFSNNNDAQSQRERIGVVSASHGFDTSIKLGESSTRRSMLRHKHTHSAKANLSIHEHLGPAHSSELAMTSGQPRQDESVQAVAKSIRVAEQTSALEPASGDQPASNSRGRSKARGQRTVSRRSRSPPRAAARGRSVALQSEERQRKAVNLDSPPLDAVRPRSDPIAIESPSRRGSDDEFTSGADVRAEEDTRAAAKDDDDDEPRRGRSPVERSRRVLRMSRASPNTKSSAVLSESRGRRAVSSRGEQDGKSSSSVDYSAYDAQAKVDPGFDDIENLDLEA